VRRPRGSEPVPSPEAHEALLKGAAPVKSLQSSLACFTPAFTRTLLSVAPSPQICSLRSPP